MDGFIMMKEFEIELPQPDEKGADKNEDKNPFKSEIFFDGMG